MTAPPVIPADIQAVLDRVLTPGKKTTEFLGAIVVTVLQFAVGIVAIWQPGFHVTPGEQTLIVGEVGLAVPAVWTWYSSGRKNLKATALKLVTGTWATIQASGVQLPTQVTQAAGAVSDLTGGLARDLGTLVVPAQTGTSTAPTSVNIVVHPAASPDPAAPSDPIPALIPEVTLHPAAVADVVAAVVPAVVAAVTPPAPPAVT